MIRKTVFLFVIVTILSSCTKEVPERERKASKSEDDVTIRKVIDNYYTAYNSGDIETAVELLDQNYRGVVSDSIDVIGVDAAKDDLLKYYRQYPKGQWENKIEEITVGDGYAFALSSSSFLMPNPVEMKPAPIHSERAMRVLKKDKIRGWKIFRYIAMPTFTYDDK